MKGVIPINFLCSNDVQST